MAVPKSRHSSSRRDRRRSHLGINPPELVSCSKCGKPRRPHRACPSCGFYRGREAVNVLEKLEKKERKKREKAIAAKEKEASHQEALDMKELSKK